MSIEVFNNYQKDQWLVANSDHELRWTTGYLDKFLVSAQDLCTFFSVSKNTTEAVNQLFQEFSIDPSIWNVQDQPGLPKNIFTILSEGEVATKYQNTTTFYQTLEKTKLIWGRSAQKIFSEKLTQFKTNLNEALSTENLKSLLDSLLNVKGWDITFKKISKEVSTFGLVTMDYLHVEFNAKYWIDNYLQNGRDIQDAEIIQEIDKFLSLLDNIVKHKKIPISIHMNRNGSNETQFDEEYKKITNHLMQALNDHSHLHTEYGSLFTKTDDCRYLSCMTGDLFPQFYPGISAHRFPKEPIPKYTYDFLYDNLTEEPKHRKISSNFCKGIQEKFEINYVLRKLVPRKKKTVTQERMLLQKLAMDLANDHDSHDISISFERLNISFHKKIFKQAFSYFESFLTVYERDPEEESKVEALSEEDKWQRAFTNAWNRCKEADETYNEEDIQNILPSIYYSAYTGDMPSLVLAETKQGRMCKRLLGFLKTA